MTTINPYLAFAGNCEEAFDFYKSVFGGEFSYVGRFKDMPDNPECPIDEEDKEKIMHISLPIGGDTMLMGSDTSKAAPPVVNGTNITISINTDSVEESDRLFAGLSEGGQVMMPMDKTFWGAYFGMFTDKFGVQWMVNCALK